jgi:hypothetical protein
MTLPIQNRRLFAIKADIQITGEKIARNWDDPGLSLPEISAPSCEEFDFGRVWVVRRRWSSAWKFRDGTARLCVAFTADIDGAPFNAMTAFVFTSRA